ncbi:hypothetical protein [Micromonospora musae]|uniref:hypothetical protein n=1 Tax=Micromonospora musae TaxID=1894970 RepID=UPI0033F3A010
MSLKQTIVGARSVSRCRMVTPHFAWLRPAYRHVPPALLSVGADVCVIMPDVSFEAGVDHQLEDDTNGRLRSTGGPLAALAKGPAEGLVDPAAG